MSSAQVALLPPPARGGQARLGAEGAHPRQGIPLAAFALLAAYGTVRWATLIRGREDGHLLGMLVVAVLVAGVGVALVGRSRLAVVGLAVVGLVAMFPLAGFPLAWTVHFRVAVTAHAVGHGLSALPGVLVPYNGFDSWVRAVILLGAGVLLLDGAVMLVLLPRSLGRLGRTGAALPLIALAAVPAALVHPQLAYADGLVLFALLGMLVWGGQIPPERAGAAVGLLTVAAVIALVAAPALDRHRPWLNFQALASRLEAPTETFDWTQRYGAISWPREGRAVLEVQATRPEYWKAENLDAFDGHGWSTATVRIAANAISGVSAATRRRWTQTLTVTLSGISTPELIAAGTASAPTGLSEALTPGASAGTWLSAPRLGAGDSYRVRVYDPQPSVAELAAAGIDYPQAIRSSDLQLELPVRVSSATGARQALVPVMMPAFGSSASTARSAGADSAAALQASAYAGAFALSRRLLRGARTPYSYTRAILRYLAHGFAYNENPPPARYPIEAFLTSSRSGYCQQFAGAMALLLRLGGVPARVAVGFTPGTYDTATRRWIVSDTDAHAWVEAFFPGYGWVRFDPTPSADPALAAASHQSAAATSITTPSVTRHPPARGVSRAVTGTVARRAGSTSFPVALVAGAAAIIAVAMALAAWLLRPLAGLQLRIDEVERAFQRAGRPLPARCTLLALEDRLDPWPAAAAYVRALRLERFGRRHGSPHMAGRRELRRALVAGLGPLAWVRGLWALPPRRSR